MKMLKLIGLIPVLMLCGNAAHAFVGGLAVALGRTAKTEEVKTPFSADALVETETNKATSRVYYRPGMVRDDMDMGGQRITTIQRYDLGKVWVLMGQGMYMEQKIGESEQAPEYKLVERSVLGKETVNGMETTKYKTVYEGPDGRFTGLTWFTDNNIAVKGDIVAESKGDSQRILFTLTNLKRGKQPASLFEVPQGAQRLNLPNMGGIMGMAGHGGTMAMAPSRPASTAPAVPQIDKEGLTADYLHGSWCSSWSINSERGLYVFDNRGDYQIGTPSGDTYDLRPRSGGDLQHFKNQFKQLVSLDRDQFSVLDKSNRKLVFVRGGCNGVAGNHLIESTPEAATQGAEEATVDSVYRGTKNAIQKGFNKLLNW